jgi:hypothetical protein
MKSFVKEFLDDITVNPAKSKVIIKWILYISLTLIAGAFTLGVMKSDRFNKINNIENRVMAIQVTVNDINTKLNQLNNKTDSGFKMVDKKLSDNIVTTATLMSSYQGFVQGQMEILIDYGKENKGLLKSALLLRQEDNQRLINQTVKSAIDEINKKPNDDSYTSGINIVKAGEDYGTTVLTMKNATTKQMDSISSNYKIMSVELQNNGKYKIVYKIK